MCSNISHENFDTHFNQFMQTISLVPVIEKHAPSKQCPENKTGSNKNRGLPRVLVSIKNKQKLYQSYFLNGNAYEKSFYKLYANKLTRVKNLSKKNVLQGCYFRAKKQL